jgi:hypothetical protein
MLRQRKMIKREAPAKKSRGASSSQAKAPFQTREGWATRKDQEG